MLELLSQKVLLLDEGQVSCWYLRTVKLPALLLAGQVPVPSGQLCAAAK